MERRGTNDPGPGYRSAPLPGSASRAAPDLEAELEGIRVSLAQLDGWREAVDYQRDRIDRLAQEVKNVAAEVFGTGLVFATKKEAFLHAYRQHPDYGDRSVAAKGLSWPPPRNSARHCPLLRL